MQKFIAAALAATSLAGVVAVTAAPAAAAAQPYGYGYRHHGYYGHRYYRPYYRHHGFYGRPYGYRHRYGY